MITEDARAKINLTLHVTGQREDGYHLLDSLVVFAGIADTLYATNTGVSSLTIEGPFGRDIPSDTDNLVLRVVTALGMAPTAFTLIKNLPPASGIGGGSADAAAAIRAILRLECDAPLPETLDPLDLFQRARGLIDLGADLPVCLMSHPARMRGIGERLALQQTPPCWIALVNPRVEVPTPQVFAALQSKQNSPMPDVLPKWPNATCFADWLQTQRNDLQAPALEIAPVIGDAIAALAAQSGALIARMSGSGATCFALFATQAEAAAAAAISIASPEWWTVAGFVDRGRYDASNTNETGAAQEIK